MELKQDMDSEAAFRIPVLIVPSGIETYLQEIAYTPGLVLIVPSGIETVVRNLSASFPFVLIVPSGIETR